VVQALQRMAPEPTPIPAALPTVAHRAERQKNQEYEFDIWRDRSDRQNRHLPCVSFLLQLKMSAKNDNFQSGSGACGKVFHRLSGRGERNVVNSSEYPRRRGHGGAAMSNDPDKVWPTGLTLREAEEVHSYLIDGTRVFGAIALLAHILVAVTTPWLG
jgi:light-harvesting protein B-800-850 beta chain